MTVSAHFDGRVIVPDEPLDLPPNQALIVQIERVGGEAVPSDDSALTWLAANAVASEVLPTDLADRHDHYLYGRTSTDEHAAYRRIHPNLRAARSGRALRRVLRACPPQPPRATDSKTSYRAPSGCSRDR